jgi:hypothetical protein
VSLSGNTGLVGAYHDDDKGFNSGSAYVFRGLDTSTGSVTQNVKLTASDGAANDEFGYCVRRGQSQITDIWHPSSRCFAGTSFDWEGHWSSADEGAVGGELELAVDIGVNAEKLKF